MRINRGRDIPFGLSEDFARIGLEQEALSMPETALTLRVLGRPDDMVRVVEKHLSGNTTPYDRLRFGGLLGSAGDYDRARPMLEEAWQWYGEQVAHRGNFDITHAAALVAIRRDAGDETGVDEILAAIKDNVRRYREIGYTNGSWHVYVSPDFEEGLADFLAGERKKGLELIARGVEDGFFIMPNEAYLQTLYDDSGFAPILAIQEARQSRERDKFLAIVCADNPYEEVWQPVEGTCEQFAAGGGN